MRYAWIDNEKIRDIFERTDFTVDECFHPDVAKLFDTQVPDGAKVGDGWIDGELVSEPAVPTEPTP